MSLSLDQILMAAQEAKRQEQQREAAAQMVDEIERIKAEDWQPPIDVDACYVPENLVPADWWLQEQIAKHKASQGLAEEPKEPETQAWYTVEDTD
jgi:hypothetical protein